MPNEAINLFDANSTIRGLGFVEILKAAGWTEHVFENSTLMKKDGCEAVFKLFNLTTYSMQRGYHLFAEALFNQGENLQAYPHLPRIYRYRPGVCVQERLGIVNEEELEEWSYEMGVFATRVSLDKDFADRCGAFLDANPKVLSCMMFILKFVAETRFERMRLRLSVKQEDILQRPDGTCVILDPLI